MKKVFLKGAGWAAAATIFICHSTTAQTPAGRTLEEVQVKSSRKLKAFRLGAAHCFSTSSLSPGYRNSVVVLLKPSAPARLSTVEVGTPALFRAEGIWRVIVLSSKDGQPDDPLLTDTVLIHANKKQRFYKVSLEHFGIRADTAGIFVGVEWMTKYERREKGPPNHLALKMVRCDDAAETFVSHQALGWRPFAEMESLAEDGATTFTKAAISGTFLPPR